MNNNKVIEVSLIDSNSKNSSFFKRIISPINDYLLRNKSAVSDFNLIKDIVDRNIDKEEDEIGGNLPIPLYLGLIGTMLGIIIGLMGMPSLSSEAIQSSEQTMQGVDILLSGVKIAMIASVLGLILTTINSFYFYKVRKSTESKKNNFFTFIQTHLLPSLSKNTASSLQTLQSNLLKFNEGFTTNMNSFNSVIQEVRGAFDSQLQVVEELKRLDVSNMAKYNIDVMQEMRKSFKQLNKLSDYLQNVNGLLTNTNQLNHTITEQLNQVNNITSYLENFNSNAVTISEGSNYIKSHFKNFDDREQAINNRLATFDSNVDDMFSNLKVSFNDRLQKFNESDTEFNSGFNELFGDINKGFENLFVELKSKTQDIFDDESQNISSINTNVVDLQDNYAELSKASAEVINLNKALSEQNKTIIELLINKEKQEEEKYQKKTTDNSPTHNPLEFKLPKLMKIAIIVILAMIFIATSIFILKSIKQLLF